MKKTKVKKKTSAKRLKNPLQVAAPEVIDDEQSEIIQPEVIDPSEVITQSEVVIPDVVDDSLPDLKDEVAAEEKGLVTTDPVQLYLAELRKYPLLTKEQERDLAIRYREQNDSKAAELLVTSNLRFVVKIAAEYSKFGARMIDLIQEGNVGLMHAVREFNPYKGTRLITYAVWWIRGYIQEYLMRQYSLVRIGTTQNQRKLFYRLQKEKELLDKMGKQPNLALISSRLGVTEEEVEMMSKRMSGRDISLDAPVGDDESGTRLIDFESDRAPGVDEEIGRAEELAALRENIDKIRERLNEKEAYILEHRLLADEPMTLQEIGDHFKITREAVRQVEARLIGRLRSELEAVLQIKED
jgi:RNA polymerase sigma-32 factor